MEHWSDPAWGPARELCVTGSSFEENRSRGHGQVPALAAPARGTGTLSAFLSRSVEQGGRQLGLSAGDKGRLVF